MERSNKKKSENKNKAIYWLLGSSIILSIIAICSAFVHKDTIVTNESIVLVFVGILATFIVVSNYLQVRDIKEDFQFRVNELNDSFDNKIESLDLKIKEEYGESIQNSEQLFNQKIDYTCRFIQAKNNISTADIYYTYWLINKEDRHFKLSMTYLCFALSVYVSINDSSIIKKDDIDLLMVIFRGNIKVAIAGKKPLQNVTVKDNETKNHYISTLQIAKERYGLDDIELIESYLNNIEIEKTSQDNKE
jgi:hypothetical protein